MKREKKQPINVVDLGNGNYRIESIFWGFTRSTITTDKKLVESWTSPDSKKQAYTKHNAYMLIRQKIRQANTVNNIYHPQVKTA